MRGKKMSLARRDLGCKTSRGGPPLTREAGGGGHRKVASFQSMFLQPAIHGAAAQSQSLGSLADVSFVPGKSPLNEISFNFVKTHLLQLGRAASDLCAQTEVCRANGRARREQNAAFHRMIEFANVARPRMLMQGLDGGRV